MTETDEAGAGSTKEAAADATTGGRAKRGSGREIGRGLGRGLDALLGGRSASAPQAAEEKEIRTVPVAFLHANPDQPRRRFGEEEMAQLVASVRERGVLQPLLVRPHPERSGEYQIVAGERRWRAAQQAELHELPVVIRGFTDAETLQIAIVENVQRTDLSALEEAQGYSRLVDEFGMTHGQIADTIGKSRVHVANTLRLRDLPSEVRHLLEEGRISPGHGRALLAADDPAALAREVVEGGLTVRQTEERARGEREKRVAKPRGGASGSAQASNKQGKSHDTLVLEGELSGKLGLQVTLSGDGPKGVLSIRYESLDQLDDVLQRLGLT